MEITNNQIIDLIVKWGLKIVRQNKNSVTLFAVDRMEKTPSLIVNFRKNVFYDFGSGVGGGYNEFLVYAKGFRENLDGIPSLQFQKFNPNQYKWKDSKLLVQSKKELSNPRLFDYLSKRRIAPHIADCFCYEVIYQINGSHYYAIGFENDKGGFELRTYRYKLSSSPKGITSFCGNHKSVIVFEGFFDFLTLLTMDFDFFKKHDFIILNSLVFIHSDFFLVAEKYELVYLFLDNDSPGLDAGAKLLQSNTKFHSLSFLTSPFKDLNEWFMNNQSPVKIKLFLEELILIVSETNSMANIK